VEVRSELGWSKKQRKEVRVGITPLDIIHPSSGACRQQLTPLAAVSANETCSELPRLLETPEKPARTATEKHRVVVVCAIYYYLDRR
jgi:hypothetical protein